MRAIELADRTRLRAYFGRAPALHLYELGDLDDFFWPHTRWYALEDDGAIACYERLGFAPIGRFEEHLVIDRGAGSGRR